RPGQRRERRGSFGIDAAVRAPGPAAMPDPGFLQPVPQFGREMSPSVAGSGPVSSALSLTRITSLFGDLISGAVYATTAPLSKIGQEVVRVTLVDRSGAPVTLIGLAGGRPDPRFFDFPDGAAGLLLERTGAFYRPTELHATDAPASAPAGPPDAATRPGPSVLRHRSPMRPSRL